MNLECCACLSPCWVIDHKPSMIWLASVLDILALCTVFIESKRFLIDIRDGWVLAGLLASSTKLLMSVCSSLVSLGCMASACSLLQSKFRLCREIIVCCCELIGINDMPIWLQLMYFAFKPTNGKFEVRNITKSCILSKFYVHLSYITATDNTTFTRRFIGDNPDK